MNPTLTMRDAHATDGLGTGHSAPHAEVARHPGGDSGPGYKTYVDALRANAARFPGERGFTFLVDGDAEGATFTWAELDRRARALAVELLEHCSPGDRALLVYEQGLEYVAAFFGCLYAGIIAVPAYPPDPSRLAKTLPRLKVIADDSGPKVILASHLVMPLREHFQSMDTERRGCEWIDTEDFTDARADEWRAPEIGGATIAFLQYTSGSTSNPRGVMVTHANLIDNSETMRQGVMFGQGKVIVGWVPQYHDMGLCGTILLPVYCAGHSVLMAPMSFLMRPLRWLQAISKYKAWMSAFPNFALELGAKKATPEQRAALDLDSWRFAVNGAEPIRAASLRKFSEHFGPAGFRAATHMAGYGMAETTLVTTLSPHAEEPGVLRVEPGALDRHEVRIAAAGDANAREVVGCGFAFGATRVIIVHPDTREQYAEDAVGEIWIQGGSVAQGYWGRPEDSERLFRAEVQGAPESGTWLRSGDLGFVHEGELYVTGRIKDMIIIDGTNHYPQDIEATVESCHPSIRAGCIGAFPVDIDGAERLVVVAEVVTGGAPFDPREATAAIRKAVSACHDARVHDVVFLKTRGIPKTSSGKLQRHACKRGYLHGTLDILER